ncbi:nucleolar protein 8 [Octopus bimaculoides]|uniref:RRM domain-containing protein n=1 Tax=Octopus bimaculoides TaxID=37653 RepID=A0A0L8GGH9_OCTBM|nr:nucleolar protein 8 [Octopus bimaculoides]|eukprot:XP_014781332.1 PREDICTED: nucleolar protein 8-like [Octopus bimaculoides]
MEEPKRLFIGGLFDNVTECELKDRFKHFGKVSEIEIRNKKDESGKPIKTFAYININTTDEKLKSCMKALNCTKWRSHEMKIEIAKPSFYHNLLKVIAEQKRQLTEKEPDKMELSSNAGSGVKWSNKTFRNARLGSKVSDKKDWVKYGQALPIMRIRQNRWKIITVNPSKFCRNHKKFEWNDSYLNQTRQKFPQSKQAAKNKANKSQISKQFKDRFTPKNYDIKSSNVAKEFTAPGSVSKDQSNLMTSTVSKEPTVPDSISKDCSKSVSYTSSKELVVPDSISKNCHKSVSISVSKKNVVSKSIPKDLNCTESNITSKKLKYNDSKDDNLESSSVSKGKRVIDATTKASGYTESNKISKKIKYDSIKTSSAHKSGQSEPKKVNPLQKSQDLSAKPVKITTESVENKTLKATYVNFKVLQKCIPTKRSCGLVLQAKPSLLLKYKAINSVELKSQS